jgi:coproporphyrinogen III oxidase-like Fe-S oxidoreductase
MGDVAQRLIGSGYSCVARNTFAPAPGQSAGPRRPGFASSQPFGYSMRSAGSVIALGQRSIGRIGPLSYQNHRVPRAYSSALEERTLPIERGLLLTQDDIVRGEVIACLSADFFVDVAMFEATCGIDFHRYFNAEWNALRDFERAGALVADAAHLALTPAGRLVCDDVCRIFDRRTRMLTEACTRPRLL